MTDASDIDICVLIPDASKPKVFLDQAYAKGRLCDWPLDLLVFRVSDFEIKKEIGGVCEIIADEGKELYPNWELR